MYLVLYQRLSKQPITSTQEKLLQNLNNQNSALKRWQWQWPANLCALAQNKTIDCASERIKQPPKCAGKIFDLDPNVLKVNSLPKSTLSFLLSNGKRIDFICLMDLTLVMFAFCDASFSCGAIPFLCRNNRNIIIIIVKEYSFAMMFEGLVEFGRITRDNATKFFYVALH